MCEKRLGHCKTDDATGLAVRGVVALNDQLVPVLQPAAPPHSWPGTKPFLDRVPPVDVRGADKDRPGKLAGLDQLGDRRPREPGENLDIASGQQLGVRH